MRRLSIVTIVAALAAGCSSEVTHEMPAPREPLTVTTAAAAMVPLADRLEAGGIVTASSSAVVSARVLAPVLEVRVRAGDRVRAGQTLVVLDDRDLAAYARQSTAAVEAATQGVAAARAELAAAAAEEKLARSWHTRILALHGKNSATTQELDEAEARLASAAARMEAGQARIAQATAAADAARAQADASATSRSFTILAAPFDGLITERLVDPGNMAAPGTALLRLDAGGAARVEARVDEARVGRLSPGDKVDVWLAGADRTPVEGIVVEVGRAADADARAFTVKVALPRDLRATTGTFARIGFPGDRREALVVPSAALRRQGQMSSVFVVRDGVARLRLVQAGQVAPEGVEILAGLDPGETVVVGAPTALTDGHPVGARP